MFQPQRMHYVGGVGSDHAAVSHGGTSFSWGKPTCGFTGTQGPGVVDRATKSGVARGDVVLQLKRACRAEAGPATRRGILHAGVGL